MNKNVPRRRALQLAMAAPLLLRARPGLAAASCLPTGVESLPLSTPSTPAPTVRAPAASVFIDVSGSMAGYVARPRAAPAGHPADAGEPKAFRDVVLSLPQLAASVADSLHLFAFGKTIRPIAITDLARASDPRFYADQDSRIQDALGRMNALPPDEVGLLITDLFLSGDEVFAGAASLRAPLASMLDGGRSIALVGVRSGFAGTVYDIPGVKPYTAATERPFYLMATGPMPAVSALLQRLRTELLSPLPPTRDGGPRFNTVVFTREPFRGGPVPLPMGPSGRAAVAPSLTPELGEDVSRIRFPAAAGTATASIPLQAIAWRDALLPDRFSVSEGLWAQPPGSGGQSVCNGHWLDIHSLSGLAQVTPGSNAGGLSLTVGGPALARATPGLTFLLRARVATAGLSETPEQTAWTRAWNLETREAEAFVASRPQMFRTLNLKEIIGMLEGILRDGIVPRPLGEALLAFQVSAR